MATVTRHELPQQSIHHHNGRFRIDFEAADAIEQTEHIRQRRETWRAGHFHHADTADDESDEYLLAMLDDSSPKRRHGRFVSRRWLSGWAVSAAVNGSICLLLMLLGALTRPASRGLMPIESAVLRAEPELIVIAPTAAPRAEDLRTRVRSLAAHSLTHTLEQHVAAEPALQLPAWDRAQGADTTGPFADALALIDRIGTSELSQDASDAEQGPGAEFYGVKASGRRFVFVVDSSRSMLGARWEAAARELLAAISRLQEGQFFYVVFFDGDPHPMFNQPASEASFAAVEERNLERLRQWVMNMTLGPDTEPLAAVRIACRLKPDAIYLLSDGEFKDKTALYLRRNNKISEEGRLKMPAAPVHTISLQSRAGKPLLERIAKENGGEFRFVE